MNYIVLFEPEKPANVGNIIRTCMALNARLILVGHINFDLNDKSLKRAGMDYMIGFPITRYDSLEEFYKDHDKCLIYYVTRYSKNVYSNMDYSDVTKDIYYMFGRESTGIPHDILLKNFEQTVRIPMAIDARSLNLSNSVAIVLSEAIRQQKFFSLSTSETIKGEDFLFNENKKLNK